MYNPPCREKTINLVINLLGKHLRKTPIAIGTRVTKIFGEIRWWHQTSKFCPNSQSWFPMVWNSWTDSKKSNDSSYCRILPMGWSNMLPKFWRSSSSSHIFSHSDGSIWVFFPMSRPGHPNRNPNLLLDGVESHSNGWWVYLRRAAGCAKQRLEEIPLPQVGGSSSISFYDHFVVFYRIYGSTAVHVYIGMCSDIIWYDMIWEE